MPLVFHKKASRVFCLLNCLSKISCFRLLPTQRRTSLPQGLITYEQFHAVMEDITHRKRLTTLEESTDAAVFTASDQGTAITGTIPNLTAGMIVDQDFQHLEQ